MVNKRRSCEIVSRRSLDLMSSDVLSGFVA